MTVENGLVNLKVDMEMMWVKIIQPTLTMTSENKIFDTEWGNELTNVLKDTYIKFINEIYAQPVDYLTRHDVHFFPWVSVYNTPHQHDVHNHVNSYIVEHFM